MIDFFCSVFNESFCLLNGQDLIPHSFESLIKKMSKFDYRTHLTFWCVDIDKAFISLFGLTVVEGVNISVGRNGLTAFHFKRLHFRSLTGWTDSSPVKISKSFGFNGLSEIDQVKGVKEYVQSLNIEIQKLGLTRMKGTSAGTAHELWRERFNPSGRWRRKIEESSTDNLDFIRRGLYGGQTISHVRGCVYSWGNMPSNLIKKLGCPAFEIPDDWGLFRIDATSAYPGMMKMGLPSPWHDTTDEFCLEKYKFGIADVTIQINESGPRLIPARIKLETEHKTIWPFRGSVTGVYSYTLLREAVKHGAKITEVKKSISFLTSKNFLKTFITDVFKHQKTISNPIVKKSIKSMSRRLNGKFAVSRWKTKVVKLSDYMDTMAEDDTAPYPDRTIGGYCVVREREPEYPSGAQPMWSIQTIDRATVVLSRIVNELEAEGNRVLYVDTDSVMFSAQKNHDGSPILPKSVEERMGEDLGQWRVDWKGEWVIIFGDKFYATNDSCNFAGVPRDLQKELLYNGTAQYNTKESVFRGSQKRTYTINNGAFKDESK